ncbi:MAG: universal stress protein [Deltaproteobacteria bacterium]|nr:universal stress protein [Deltaproteobacteria bacterium]
MEKQKRSILVALNDSVSSRAVVDFLIDLIPCPEDCFIYLLHFFRKPSASEELMGKKFTSGLSSRMKMVLEKAKEKLVEKGIDPMNIETELVSQPYPTIADGIIDQVKRRNANLVVIGRKKMSKAEEFVMGDISIKLIRSLDGVSVLVVKSK